MIPKTSPPRRALPAASIAFARKALSAKQGYRCPICNGSLAGGTPSLDHCHLTGNVRATLCMSCNVGEGKVRVGMLFRTPKGNMAYKEPVKWLRKLADYLEFHNENPSGLIHPTFDVKTGKQKPIKRKKK
tara:strand:+ start:787 stop:1176 length:390 start_codon:yes stop_codon:yes gene_type:complete